MTTGVAGWRRVAVIWGRGATRIRLSVSDFADQIRVTVDDNGSGVPEEERTAVFERFARGSTAARSGSGLGLALVAQQAELHGGSASLEASPLGGAQLVLRLGGQGPAHPPA